MLLDVHKMANLDVELLDQLLDDLKLLLEKLFSTSLVSLVPAIMRG